MAKVAFGNGFLTMGPMFPAISKVTGSSPRLVGFQDCTKSVVSLNRIKSTFLAPLNCALKEFIFALKDSVDAFVLWLSKYFRIFR